MTAKLKKKTVNLYVRKYRKVNQNGINATRKSIRPFSRNFKVNLLTRSSLDDGDNDSVNCGNDVDSMVIANQINIIYLMLGCSIIIMMLLLVLLIR